MSLNHSPKIVTDGLVLCLDAASRKSYPGSGTTWFDRSGNGNHGTLTNGPTFNSANGGSIVFDGINDYVNIPYNSILNSSTVFTVDFWFKSNSINTEQVFFSTTNLITTGYHIEIYNAKVILQVFPSQGFTFSTKTLSSNTFYNISVSYNSGNIIYYVNAIPAGIANHTFTPSNIDLVIGKYTYNNSYNVNGNISLFRFYNKELSINEIKQNFNATRGRYGI